MRAVVQRVKQASVEINGKLVSEISHGLLILLGVGKYDDDSDVEYLANKIANLRIFEDDQRKMNLSLIDVKGQSLVVSQFTLYGNCRKGRRPSFIDAAKPQKADELYQKFVSALGETGLVVKEGVFQAFMDVKLINNGPVTILLDSKKSF